MAKEQGPDAGRPVLAKDAEGRRHEQPSDERFRLLVSGVTDYGIFMLDPGGHITSWNAGAERIKGYRAEDILGKHFSIFYPPEAVAARFPEYELEVARREGRFEDEGWRLRQDGSRFWANVVITAINDTAGRHIGFSKVTRDLTERRRQEEDLRQSEERFRLLVEGVADYGIFMLDPGGHVSSWNAGAERIKGYRRDEILGKHFRVFYPPEAVAARFPEHELEVAQREGRFEDEGWRLRKDGSLFWANVVITALFDGKGELRGFAKVTRDLTERQRLETLKEEGRQTTEFLAMLGHELRNPLAPIRNALEVMAAANLPDPGVQWARDVIARQVTHLGRLVDDLLDMSRITTGNITLHTERLDLSEVVSRAVDSSRPLVEEQGHTLSLTLPQEPLHVEGDPTRLSQVVMNLVNNAAKYTPKGGRIWVTVRSEPGQAVLSVRDSGIGMAPDFIPRIFDLFVQAERTLDRSQGGLGVGLALVRQLAARHGGTVAAFSPGPGQGSEFVVRLPALAPPGAAAPASATDAGVAQGPKTHRVLVVDDNPDSVESMSMLLQMWGHDVQVASNGTAALDLAAEHLPEVVLLDIGLPGLSGYEVAERLRAIPGLADAVLVAMTGYGQKEDFRRSEEAGFTLHLVKPLNPDALRRVFADLDARGTKPASV